MENTWGAKMTIVQGNQDRRPLSQIEYGRLKQAAKRLIKACGGLEAASMITRVGHSELARYYTHEERLFMPIDVAADLEAIASNPVITQALAHMQGYALIQLQPQETADPNNHWTTQLALLGQETASLLKQVGVALSEHGTLTAHAINHQHLMMHIDNLIQAAMQLKAAMLHRQERDYHLKRKGNNPSRDDLPTPP
jgi:hypothetical protein